MEPNAQDELSLGRIVGAAVNGISTALAVPMVWPKTTALVCLAIIGFSAAIWVPPLIRADKPPDPNFKLLSRMVQDAEKAEEKLQAERGIPLQRNPEARGVWEMMRDLPTISEDEP